MSSHSGTGLGSDGGEAEEVRGIGSLKQKGSTGHWKRIKGLGLGRHGSADVPEVLSQDLC